MGRLFTKEKLKNCCLSLLLAALVAAAGGCGGGSDGTAREKLYVAETYATPGPIIKRFMPRAQGRAYRINKRTSHVTVVVKER